MAVLAASICAISAYAQTDRTSLITNPSFETGDATGWTVTNMGAMNNDFFTVKKGTWYMEQWTWRGNTVGDARVSQKLMKMPAGRYRLKVAAQNIQEDTPSQAQTGAWIFAGTNTKNVTTRNNYTLEFVQVADELEIGFEAKNASGNWLSVDNFRLEYISDDMTDVKAELSTLIEQARQAVVTFLSSVSVTDISNPFDLTFMLENPDFDNNVTSGWTSTNGVPGYDAQGAEFFEKAFYFYQVLENMPSGTYELRANAFQRPGANDAVLTPYKNGTAQVTTSLYISGSSATVKHICDDRQSSALFNDGGWGSDVRLTDGTYIPNCMVGAEKYFERGLYDCGVNTIIDKSGSTFRVGIKCTSAPAAYWTMFDHFRLYFFGGNDTPVGIETLQTSDTTETPLQNQPIYDLTGRKVKGILSPGIYLIGGKKVLMK